MTTINYFPLFIIFVIAWAVPLTLSWLKVTRIPAVIVEIIMGVIIGPYVLDLMEDTPYMSFLAKTGFIFLIFLAGLEIDVNKIISSLPKKLRSIDLVSNSLILAIIIYFGSLLLSLPFAWLTSQFLEIDIVFFTLLLPTCALSITVPILKSDGELTRKFGQVLLMEGAIATVMSIILISIYSGVLQNGFEVELLLFTVIFAVSIGGYFIGTRLVKVKTFQKLLYRLEHAASQIRVRGTVGLLLLFVIIAHLIETELVMGAFFAGALLSMFVNKKRSSLLFKLDGMSYGFFIPIFFIMVGVNLDLSALTQFRESIPFIVTLTAGFFITQIIPALIMTKIFGLKKALAGGILLTARLGLSIATAQIGLGLGVISSADNAGIVTSSILASLLAPLAYKLFNSSKDEVHHIYLIGGSEASLLLAERLKMHGISYMTVMQNDKLMPAFEDKSLPFKPVKALDEKIIDLLKIKSGDLVIILTESRELNQTLTKYVKHELNHGKIYTMQESVSMDLLDPNGEIKLIDPNEVLANHLEHMITSPDSIDSLAESFEDYRVEEIQITNKDLHKKNVKDIAFPPSGSLVIQKRGGEVFIPHGDTSLLMGDVLTVIGNNSALINFRKILENTN